MRLACTAVVWEGRQHWDKDNNTGSNTGRNTGSITSSNTGSNTGNTTDKNTGTKTQIQIQIYNQPAMHRSSVERLTTLRIIQIQPQRIQKTIN